MRGGFVPYLGVALLGGYAGYAVHRAADQMYGYMGAIAAPIVFFLIVQMAFAVWWRMRKSVAAHATPGVIYALALTAATIPCALLGYIGAQFGLAAGETPGEPLIYPFIREIGPFVLGFTIPMVPICWLIWNAIARRR